MRNAIHSTNTKILKGCGINFICNIPIQREIEAGTYFIWNYKVYRNQYFVSYWLLPEYTPTQSIQYYINERIRQKDGSNIVFYFQRFYLIQLQQYSWVACSKQFRNLSQFSRFRGRPFLSEYSAYCNWF